MYVCMNLYFYPRSLLERFFHGFCLFPIFTDIYVYGEEFYYFGSYLFMFAMNLEQELQRKFAVPNILLIMSALLIISGVAPSMHLTCHQYVHAPHANPSLWAHSSPHFPHAFFFPPVSRRGVASLFPFPSNAISLPSVFLIDIEHDRR